MPDALVVRLKLFALTHGWVLPVLAVALWLRLAGISQEHLYGDESEYAIVARYLSRQWDYLAYPDIAGLGAVPFVSQPPLLLYVMALSMKIFGPTDVAAILPSALFGAATIGAVYAIGHRLGGRFMGLGAAAILAALPFHIEMSRRAMLDAGYVFFLMLTAYFCIAWLQDRSRIAAVGVGVATACTALSKLPGVLAAPVVVLVFALGLTISLVRRNRVEIKETLLQGGIGVGCVAAGAFAYLALLFHLGAIQDLLIKLRWQFGRVDTSRAVVQEMAAVERDPSWYFLDPKFSFQHELMPLVWALALVGLIALAVRMTLPRTRRAEDAVIPIMTFVLFTFFMISDRKEGFYLLPFAALGVLLVAYTADSLRMFLHWGGIRFTPRLTRHTSLIALVLGIIIIAAPAYGAATKSVNKFVQGDNPEHYFGYGTKEAAAYIAERDPEAGQFGTLLGRFALHWYNEQDSYHWYVDHTFVESQIKSGHLKYVVYENYLDLPFDRDYERDLIDRYHGTAVQTFREGWGEVTVFELHPQG